MKNEWVDTLAGSVRVKARGKGIERLINACVCQGIAVWNVKKHSADTATFFIKLSDVKRLRHVARQSECKLSFVGRTGLPFFWRQAWRNSGFWLGLLLFIAIVFLLSNIVWKIEIKGAAPETEHQIARELKRMGVERGAFQFLLDDPETLQKKLRNAFRTSRGSALSGKGRRFTSASLKKRFRSRKNRFRRVISWQKKRRSSLICSLKRDNRSFPSTTMCKKASCLFLALSALKGGRSLCRRQGKCLAKHGTSLRSSCRLRRRFMC